MIIKAIISYEDGTTATFEGTPTVPATEAIPAVPVDLSTIPTDTAPIPVE